MHLECSSNQSLYDNYLSAHLCFSGTQDLTRWCLCKSTCNTGYKELHCHPFCLTASDGRFAPDLLSGAAALTICSPVQSSGHPEDTEHPRWTGGPAPRMREEVRGELVVRQRNFTWHQLSNCIKALRWWAVPLLPSRGLHLTSAFCTVSSLFLYSLTILSLGTLKATQDLAICLAALKTSLGHVRSQSKLWGKDGFGFLNQLGENGS